MNLYRSDWIGILVGVAMGSYQPFAILDKPIFPVVVNEALIPIILFGVLTPPLLALVEKFILKSHWPIVEKIGKYINLYFMMIAYGISTGVVGLAYHLSIGLPEHTFMPIVFFCSAGFGFLAAYFIQPELAYRPNEKA